MRKVSLIRGVICCLFLLALFGSNHAGVVNVKTKGAKGDGVIDDGPAIMKAWKEACDGAPPSTLLFPSGTYMAFPLVKLNGPCKGPIEIKATGATIKAPSELTLFKRDSWIFISNVDNLTMTGGTLDGQGQSSWRNKQCKDACQKPVNLRLSFVKNSLIKDLTSIDSKQFHIAVLGSDNSRLENITINAPGDSVNTDGIHIARLNGFNVTNINIKTGDDCISFGDGTKNVRVENVNCGPGHGISIGSIGKNPNEEPVEGIWIKNCTLTGTDNGARIKSWPGCHHPGSVNNVHFEDIVLKKVAYPIIIDQQYCGGLSCQKGVPSKVKISNVSFRKFKGTSSTLVAVKLNCTAESPCNNVELADINLTHSGGQTSTSRCSNVKPKVVGQIIPPACPGAGAR